MSSSKKQLARVVYRALLRASGNGRHPEVFGEFGEHAVVVRADAENSSLWLPSSAKEVRNALRNVFLQEEKEEVLVNEKASATSAKIKRSEIFEAVRRSNELASILRPQQDELPPLPIFDFSNSSALKGEELNFNLFEPRYRQLAKEATSTTNGLFVLRARPLMDEYTSSMSLSVLMKIVEHTDLEENNIAVRCVGGPRVRVLQQEEVHVRDDAPPMKRATELVLDQDASDSEEDKQKIDNINQKSNSRTELNNNGDDIERNNELEAQHQPRESLAELRRQCLELLSSLTSHRSIVSWGIPPLDPEEFSFWALRFILANNDAPSRHKWLSCHSTRRRLGFVIGLLEEFQQVKKQHREQSDTSSSCISKK